MDRADAKRAKRPPADEEIDIDQLAAPVRTKKPKESKSTKATIVVEPKVELALGAWKNGAALATLATQLGMRRKQLKRQFVKLLGGKDKFIESRANGAGGRGDFGGKRGVGARKVTVVMDDSKVPRIEMRKVLWRPPDTIVAYARKQLPTLVQRLRQARRDKSRREFKALYVEYEHLKETIIKSKKKRWHTRREQQHEPRVLKLDNGDQVLDTGTPIEIYVSPKGRSYVRAEPAEPASLLLVRGSGEVIRLVRWEKSIAHSKQSKRLAVHEETLERGNAGLERKQQRRAERKKAKLAAKRAAKHSGRKR
jgi:hypothetical protein